MGENILVNLTFSELIDYTDWQRARWRARLPASVLAMSAGPNGDGRLNTVGEIVRHIFGAEIRYCQRLSGEALTDPAAIPSNDTDALFAFGDLARARLRRFIEEMPAEAWDEPCEFTVLTFHVTATPRKVIAHALMHEIRHWAQLATLLRLEGQVGEFHDLIASPVMGGSFTVQ